MYYPSHSPVFPFGWCKGDEHHTPAWGEAACLLPRHLHPTTHALRWPLPRAALHTSNLPQETHTSNCEGSKKVKAEQIALNSETCGVVLSKRILCM